MKNYPSVGFKIPKNRKSLIDWNKIKKPDGTFDYKLLIDEINKLGIRLQKESKIIENLRNQK